MLNRMEIEEAGPDPVSIATEVHRQMGFLEGAINLESLAKELDILEIKYSRLKNFEGALIFDKSRDRGSILINSNSFKERRRFTLAHELGHFLNLWHVPEIQTGFWCSQTDLSSTTKELSKTNDRYVRQEIEANRFASELLMPRKQIISGLEDYGALDHVYAFAKNYKVSKEAMARRYVELHSIAMSVIFSKDGKMRYPVVGEKMPRLKVKEGQELPHLGLPSFSEKERAGAEIDPSLWLHNSEEVLICEHFNQANGYAMTLLQIYN